MLRRAARHLTLVSREPCRCVAGRLVDDDAADDLFGDFKSAAGDADADDESDAEAANDGALLRSADALVSPSATADALYRFVLVFAPPNAVPGDVSIGLLTAYQRALGASRFAALTSRRCRRRRSFRRCRADLRWPTRRRRRIARRIDHRRCVSRDRLRATQRSLVDAAFDVVTASRAFALAARADSDDARWAAYHAWRRDARQVASMRALTRHQHVSLECRLALMAAAHGVDPLCATDAATS